MRRMRTEKRLGWTVGRDFREPGSIRVLRQDVFLLVPTVVPSLAIVATLIVSAKLNDIEPLAWLADVLERVVSRRTKP